MRVFVNLSWVCLVTSCALPFIAQKGTYKDAEPRHVGPGAKQREYIIEVTSVSTPKQSPGAMLSVVHAVLICYGCFLGNARVMMGVVHVAAWVYCLLVECTGTPPAEWTGRRLPAEWTCIIKCGGGTSPTSGMDRAQ
jgi:hypothetical protein